MPSIINATRRPELQLHLSTDRDSPITFRVSRNLASTDSLVGLPIDQVSELRFGGGPDLVIDIRVITDGSARCGAALRLQGLSVDGSSSNGEDLVVRNYQVTQTGEVFALEVTLDGQTQTLQFELATGAAAAGQTAIEPQYRPPRSSPPPCVDGDGPTLTIG